MLYNYLLIAFRNLRKNKTFSFINIVGLTLGLASLYTITLYLLHEVSYDRFHPLPDRTYRVISIDSSFNNTPTIIQFNVLASTFKRISGIDKVARIEPAYKASFKYGNDYFAEDDFRWADPEVLELFALPFAYGNPKTALSEPNSLVLTSEAALKYFGNAPALGKVLELDSLRLTVTGVLKPLPSNTHLDFTLLGSYSTLQHPKEPWKHQGSMYVRLHKQVQPRSIEQAMAKAAHSAIWWYQNHNLHYRLQPLSDIHLQSSHMLGQRGGNEAKYLYIFGTVAFIIAFSTGLNYVNLTTARYLQRIKEVGVRKAIGASRANLMGQFLGESVLFSLVGLLLAVTLLQLIMPWLTGLLGVSMASIYSRQVPVIGLFLGLALLLGLLAGFYPSVFLSRFKPDLVLKGAKLVGGGGQVREWLLVLQFFITITLLATTLLIGQQLHYVSNKPLGFEKEQVLLLSSPGSAKLNFSLAKQELQRIPTVDSVASASGSPVQGGGMQAYDTIQGQPYKVTWTFADEDYVKTLGMKIRQGRDFSKEFSTDADQAVLVNQAMVKAKGWKQPIGQALPLYGSEQVVGVVEDFHTASLHEPIQPVMIKLDTRATSGKHLLVRFKTQQVLETTQAIKQAWQKFAPTLPLKVSFLSKDYQALYQREQRLRNIVFVFSALAILIGCLGLLGLATFTAKQRTKEIGVHKVLGATVGQIFLLLSFKFCRLITVALALAIPVAWYLSSVWLKAFAYRISITGSVFIVAGTTTFILALLIISFPILKVAKANPVKSLRSE